MASLAIEQKLQEQGYQRTESGAGIPNHVNLGGFAISFENLLQRVGARLDQAYTTTEQGAGIAFSNDSADAANDPRDFAPSRDHGDSRNDHRSNDDTGDRGRANTNDHRDNGQDRSADAPRDRTADNSNDRASGSERDSHSARDKSETADNGNTDDTASNDGNKEAAADSKNDGNNSDQTANTGGEKAATGDTANSSAIAQGQNATQAAAVYAAGLIKQLGGTNANIQQGDTQTQAQSGANTAENPALQAAAAQVAKKGPTAHNNAQRGSHAQNKAANGSEQKATSGEQKSTATGAQAQAQQLSRALGSDTRANINVNVTNEQTQLTSKPAFTVANGTVLAQDASNGNSSSTNAQTGQQQGQNPGQSQQAQHAAQQQAQTTQQANVQNAQQPGQAGASQSGTGGTNTLQSSAGGAQHAGGNEAMNNTSQATNGAQQTQVAQQSRETAPQQQTQQAQRANLPGSAVTEQISVKITKALQTGTDRISIQLKPAELGRVDVKMEMTHDGRVMTVVTAEKQDTLDLLRRDSSELQKALADAGLDGGDMQFNLQGQEQQNAEAEDSGNGSADESEAEAEAETDANDGVMSAWESGIFANGRLDMRA